MAVGGVDQIIRGVSLMAIGWGMCLIFNVSVRVW
jgi:hypothetical protein